MLHVDAGASGGASIMSAIYGGRSSGALGEIRHTLVPRENASAYWPICGASHPTPVLWERGPWSGEPRLAHP
eukprot:scaffold21755_cov123-Isochrysis_galbana.AAC.2